MRKTDTILVSFDRDEKDIDNAVLIVGKQDRIKGVDIINAFAGKEAEMIYLNLITQRKKEEE